MDNKIHREKTTSCVGGRSRFLKVLAHIKRKNNAENKNSKIGN